MAKGKYYAVKCGRKPGIFLSWEECKEQVENFPNAKYQEKMRKHTCLPIRHIQKGSITMRCGRDTFLVYMIPGRAVNSKLMGFRIQSTENSQTKKRQRNGSPMMYETPQERVVEPMSMAVLMPTLGCMDMVSC